MNRNSILSLRIVIVLIAVGVLALMLWEPHLEGRNAYATPFEIYFKDPFLAYAYIGSIPFFAALYQASKLLGYIGQNNKQSSIQALRRIKYCGLALVGFVIGGEVFILLGSGEDDKAGGVVMGLLAILISGAIAAAAAVFEKRLKL